MSKTNYLCIVRSESGSCSEPSPSDMDDMMANFQTWMEKYRENIVDIGAHLGGGKVVQNGQVLDGPYTEAKEIIGGYMIISGEDIDEAINVTRECPPIAASGCAVEVREIKSEG